MDLKEKKPDVLCHGTGMCFRTDLLCRSMKVTNQLGFLFPSRPASSKQEIKTRPMLRKSTALPCAAPCCSTTSIQRFFRKDLRANW